MALSKTQFYLIYLGGLGLMVGAVPLNNAMLPKALAEALPETDIVQQEPGYIIGEITKIEGRGVAKGDPFQYLVNVKISSQQSRIFNAKAQDAESLQIGDKIKAHVGMCGAKPFVGPFGRAPFPCLIATVR